MSPTSTLSSPMSSATATTKATTTPRPTPIPSKAKHKTQIPRLALRSKSKSKSTTITGCSPSTSQCKLSTRNTSKQPETKQLFQTPPTTRRAPGRHQIKTHQRKRSSGPLSETTMSQIRCPTRVDFLNAINGVAPSSSSFGTVNALARSSQRYLSNNKQHDTISSPKHTSNMNTTPLVSLRTSTITDDNERTLKTNSSSSSSCTSSISSTPPTSPSNNNNDNNNENESLLLNNIQQQQTGLIESDDEGVPAYLNKLVLDAMDRISDCDELRAIVTWMDAVRTRIGYTSSITDVDLSNGIALLQTLLIVAPESFDKLNNQDLALVRTHLDANGEAAMANIDNVISALYRFPWRDGVGGERLECIPFERVDTWGLAGFIVLAAVSGIRSDTEVDHMLQMDVWVQDRLSDVVNSGLEALGATGDKGGGVFVDRENSGMLLAERKRRDELQEEVMDLMRSVRDLEIEKSDLFRQLEESRRDAEHSKSELRKAKETRRGGSDVAEGQDDDEWKDKLAVSVTVAGGGSREAQVPIGNDADGRRRNYLELKQ